MEASDLKNNLLSHFKKVLVYLKWNIDDDFKTMVSKSHFLVKFKYLKKTFIFRYARFSEKQIQRQVIAYDLLKSFAPKIYYFDDFCLIEEYIKGEVFTLKTKNDLWQKLGLLLAEIHENKGFGFGLLTTSKKSKYSNLIDSMKIYFNNFSLIYEQNILSKKEISKLESFLFNPPKSSDNSSKICHGDFWLQNIIYSEKALKIQLIDWEHILSNYREYDFVPFCRLEDERAIEITKILKKSYGHDLNQDLINYFIIIRTVSRYIHHREN